MRPSAWDKYEVALLIDMYQRIKAGAISREAGLAELSNNLRQMAINRGVQIDDVYRNLSGMSWQMAIIDKMFTERYSYGRKPAAVFTEMVALYNDEREQYKGIDFVLNCDKERKPGIMSISFPGRDSEQLLHRLDLKGIMISTGAACNSVNMLKQNHKFVNNLMRKIAKKPLNARIAI